jgi:tetratricopeptide (TPR) repeat protein
VLVVVGLAVSVFLIWREKEETRKALATAEKRTRWARQAVNEMYTQVAEKWLAGEPHMTGLQRDFLFKALKFYEDLVQEKGTDPDVRFEVGIAYRRLGDIDVDLRRIQEPDQNRPQTPAGPERAVQLLGPDHTDGLERYRQSIAVLEELVAEFPEKVEYRHELAISYLSLGLNLRNRDHFPDAEEALNRAASIDEQLVRVFPDTYSYQLNYATVLCELGELRKRTSQMFAAERDLRQALALEEQLCKRFPAERSYRIQWAYSSYRLGELLLLMDQVPAAEREARSAREAFERLVAEGPVDPPLRLLRSSGLGGSCNLHAALLLELGRVPEAEQATRRSLEVRRKACEDFSERPDWQSLACSFHAYGRILAYQGKREEARQAYRQAVHYHEKASPAGTSNRFKALSALFHHNLARILAADPSARPSDVEEALVNARCAVELAPSFAAHWTTLALVHYRAGNWAAAAADIERNTQRPLEASTFDLFVAAMISSRRKDHDRARHWYEQAIKRMAVSRLPDEEARLNAEYYRATDITASALKLRNEDLRQLRAEAAALLGIASSASPKAKEESPGNK